ACSGTPEQTAAKGQSRHLCRSPARSGQPQRPDLNFPAQGASTSHSASPHRTKQKGAGGTQRPPFAQPDRCNQAAVDRRAKAAAVNLVARTRAVGAPIRATASASPLYEELRILHAGWRMSSTAQNASEDADSLRRSRCGQVSVKLSRQEEPHAY